VNIALREILKDESKNKRYAVVGLPCHIHGIRKAEILNTELARRILLHVGLFCSSEHTFMGTLYLLWKMGLEKEEVTRLTYRGKGWLGGMTIDLKDGNTRFYPYRMYNKIWRSFFVPIRCTLCIDQCSELADISCGEIWLPEFMNDKTGTSAIICRSRIGAEILQRVSARGRVQLKKVDRERLVESQRDQLILKKSFLSTRFCLFRLIHKDIPFYNQELLPTSLGGLLHSLALYAQVCLSSRRCFLKLLPPLAFLLQKIRAIYSISEGEMTKVSC
jgi:coenzyme F420 hydrogenase subunit beta